MYSRVTLLEIDPLRVDLDAALALFEEEVLPDLRELEGYEGVFVLLTPEGRGMIVSLWETEDQARQGVAFQGKTLARYVTLFRSPPGRELYDVALADLPAHA